MFSVVVYTTEVWWTFNWMAHLLMALRSWVVLGGGYNAKNIL